jgi:hypothetical protein
MSTEQKDLEENALASRLSRTWEKFKQGRLISYRMMALLIIAVAAIGLTWYILRERAKEASRVWFELESVNTLSSLEEFSTAHPNTKAARIARMNVARIKLGPDGIEALAARDPKEQQKAVENIEAARKTFEELAGEFKDDPALKAECYLGCAKAEEALIGISQKDRPLELRGSPDKLAEWLDRLAEAAPNTPWGEDAKKLAAAIRDNKDNTRNELINVQSALARLPAPSLDMHPPILPPGGAPPVPTPPVPGVPGGFTPEKPGATPPGTGTPTPPGPMAPTGPTPPAGTPPPTPGTTPPAPQAPAGDPPMPQHAAPGAKPPEKKDTTPPDTPRPPEPKAPAPTPAPAGSPKPPMAPMPPMSPMPPKM